MGAGRIGGLPWIVSVAAAVVFALGVGLLLLDSPPSSTATGSTFRPNSGRPIARARGAEPPATAPLPVEPAGTVSVKRAGRNAVLTWTTPPITEDGPVSAFVVDVDRDGEPDFTVTVPAILRQVAGGVSGIPGFTDSFVVPNLPTGSTYSFSLQTARRNVTGPTGPTTKAVAF